MSDHDDAVLLYIYIYIVRLVVFSYVFKCVNVILYAFNCSIIIITYRQIFCIFALTYLLIVVYYLNIWRLNLF